MFQTTRGADWPVLRFANQRNPRFAVDGLRFRAVGGFDPTISGREATQQIEDGVFTGRGPDRTGLHSRTEEMASALCRDRGAMAVPESGDWSALSCRFDSCRLPGSDRSPVGTWQDRVPHVPPLCRIPEYAELKFES